MRQRRLQLGPLGFGECRGQTRRNREDNAPVIVLAANEARLDGFDEFLDAAVGKQALPLDNSLFRIEVDGGERCGCASSSAGHIGLSFLKP
ncbi:hypothetical protein [Streptomyces sp. NPDC058463]|uniref:hypothetical protein n=1 Tax=Streptomyces sp. NPDC058463 TaxID=3346510 RepID=UPI0036585D98